MNGAALGEPVAMTAGVVQLKLRGEELELGQYTVYAIFPVSYTHLDVYKRQVEGYH